MAKAFQLRVVTAEGTALNAPVTYCSLFTPEGSVGVLANHAPMLCALAEGELLYRTEDGSEKRLKHAAGVARVQNNAVTVLTDRTEEA